MNNKISDKLNTILVLSKEEAERLSHPEVMPEHVLLGMLRDTYNKAVDMLLSLNVNLLSLKSRLESLQSSSDHTVTSKVSIENISVSVVVTRLLKISALEARLRKSDEVQAEHMLLAIARDHSARAAQILSEYHVDYKKLSEVLPKEDGSNVQMGMGGNYDDEDDDDFVASSPSDSSSPNARNSGSATATRQSGSKTPVLDSFSVDMTLAALEGRMDPVVGREKEIERSVCRTPDNGWR